MNQAIRYYQRKLDAANDLTGIAYVCKLIQLGHQPTIEKTLDGLKRVQYPRHFPNHLVVQLARLNRTDINENLITYFKMHFKATNTDWHAIGALQDDRVVETVVAAINQYEKTYFSRKVVTRCIHLLGRIGSPSAYLALRNIIEAYFETDNRFISNYELPLASEALDALRRIKDPAAQDYLQTAEHRYQQRIEAELATYPARLQRERTHIGIKLHEGSALDRMRQYALPTLIDWHCSHPSDNVRYFALQTLLSSLHLLNKQNDPRVKAALRYLLSMYDEIKANHKLIGTLRLLASCNDETVIPFAWRVFKEGLVTDEALNVLAAQKATACFADVRHRFYHVEDIRHATRTNMQRIKSYIYYFGEIATPEAESILLDLYHENLPHLQISITEALLQHAQQRDSALQFMNHIIETNPDLYTVKQAIYLISHVGERSLLALLGLLHHQDYRMPYAIEALGLLRNPIAAPHVIQCLLDARPDSDLETAIIKALERIGTETCFAALNAWEDTRERHA